MTIEQIFALAVAGLAGLCMLFFIAKITVRAITKGIREALYKFKQFRIFLHSAVLVLHFLIAVVAGVSFVGLLPIELPALIFAVPVALGVLIAFRCFISRKNQLRRYFLGCMVILQTVCCLVPLLSSLL